MTTRPFPQRPPLPAAPPEVSLGAYLPSAAKRAAAEAAPATSPTTAQAAARACDRLSETIERETAALEAHEPIDLDDMNRRKSQSLLELTRLSRLLTPDDAPRLSASLDRLRDCLARNQRVVELNLTAVREIADLMVGVVSESESDGTYGMTRSHRAGGP